MGWKAAALLVENRTTADIVREIDVFRPGSREVEMVEAWYELAVAQIGAWAVFFSGGKRHPDLIATLSKDTRVFAFDLNSVYTSYGFDYFVDGRCVRSAHYTERECVRSEGPMLAAERKLKVPKWGHDDDWVLAVMHRVIGVGAGDLEEATYTVLEP